jgi:hypothetical protein
MTQKVKNVVEMDYKDGSRSEKAVQKWGWEPEARPYNNRKYTLVYFWMIHQREKTICSNIKLELDETPCNDDRD